MKNFISLLKNLFTNRLFFFSKVSKIRKFVFLKECKGNEFLRECLYDINISIEDLIADEDRDIIMKENIS